MLKLGATTTQSSETFAPHCYLTTAALGTRSEGRAATRAAYVAYFTAFLNLAPEDESFAFGDDDRVSWGTCEPQVAASGSVSLRPPGRSTFPSPT